MVIYYDHHRKPHEKPDGEPVNWRPTVYGVLENDQGEWLMVEPTWAKQWDLPGGGVEKEESVEDALVREFYEETGYRVSVSGTPLFLEESRFVHKALGFCHCLTLFYKVELVSGKRSEEVVNTFEDGYEIRDSKWIHPSKLTESDVHPIYWPFIQSQQ